MKRTKKESTNIEKEINGIISYKECLLCLNHIQKLAYKSAYIWFNKSLDRIDKPYICFFYYRDRLESYIIIDREKDREREKQ